MRGWDFIYRSWFKSIFQWQESKGGFVKIELEADFNEKLLTIDLGNGAAKLDFDTAKKLQAAIGQVLRADIGA